jgi:mono/diheme cytochrome c family protein
VTPGAVFRALVLLIVVLVVAGAAAIYSILGRGLSTRVPPSSIEATISRAFRGLATPRSMRNAKNPVEPTAAVLDEALAHFADHCASCHGNDGSGQTDIGRSFYPPAPDMRAAPTQSLTDGELFSIIENGIRLTAMPGWGNGTAESAYGSWGLVHFIRHLPRLTPEEIAEMEALNPKTPEEWEEMQAEEAFLSGEAAPEDPAASSPSHSH